MLLPFFSYENLVYTPNRKEVSEYVTIFMFNQALL